MKKVILLLVVLFSIVIFAGTVIYDSGISRHSHHEPFTGMMLLVDSLGGFYDIPAPDYNRNVLLVSKNGFNVEYVEFKPPSIGESVVIHHSGRIERIKDNESSLDSYSSSGRITQADVDAWWKKIKSENILTNDAAIKDFKRRQNLEMKAWGY